LALLESAVGAFVHGSEDEHWEVRVATLEAMASLAEGEYRTVVAAAVTAAESASVGGGGGGAGGGGSGGIAAGASTAAAAAAGAAGLSVRIGGIGGSAGGRIAAGGGNVEAASAVCEALTDALLDELPEVRQAAAAGVVRLLKLEADARRQLAAAAAETAAAVPPPRRSLPALLNDEMVRGLITAVRDT
ncbi:hypothetical protein Agub_g14717, partial [Astrephomene gubernaculifera]